jgi:hypothetical protein
LKFSVGSKTIEDLSVQSNAIRNEKREGIREKRETKDLDHRLRFHLLVHGTNTNETFPANNYRQRLLGVFLAFLHLLQLSFEERSKDRPRAPPFFKRNILPSAQVSMIVLSPHTSLIFL